MDRICCSSWHDAGEGTVLITVILGGLGGGAVAVLNFSYGTNCRRRSACEDEDLPA